MKGRLTYYIWAVNDKIFTLNFQKEKKYRKTDPDVSENSSPDLMRTLICFVMKIV